MLTAHHLQIHISRKDCDLCTHLMARSPKRMPSSGPRLMVVRARRRAGAWQVRALMRRWLPLPARAVYTAACTCRSHHMAYTCHLTCITSLGQPTRECFMRRWLPMPACAAYTAACACGRMEIASHAVQVHACRLTCIAWAPTGLLTCSASSRQPIYDCFMPRECPLLGWSCQPGAV